jgi:uncharacterized membrane protein
MARVVVFWFAAVLLAVVIGFWPTYVVRIGEMSSWRVHAHGALLLAWCLLLVAQAWLIRDRRGALHRNLGKVSFALVPLIVVSSVVVEHGALVRAAGKLDEEALFFAYLVMALMSVFLLAFVLAIAHRKVMALHMRYMTCTLLAMFDPVFARILDVRFGIQFPVQQMITFAMIDAILLWLCYRDRDTPHRAFHGMLAAFVAVQVPAFFVYKTAWWRDVVAWFATLPIS